MKMRLLSVVFLASFVNFNSAASTKCSEPYQRLTDAQMSALKRGIIEDMLVEMPKREAKSLQRSRLTGRGKRQPNPLELASPPHQRWNWGDQIWSMPFHVAAGGPC